MLKTRNAAKILIIALHPSLRDMDNGRRKRFLVRAIPSR
jgi:hypothetical protein